MSIYSACRILGCLYLVPVDFWRLCVHVFMVRGVFSFNREALFRGL